MALVAGGILVASVLPRTAGPVPPTVPGPAGIFGADKWLHAAAYATLAGTLAFALSAPGPPDSGSWSAVAILAVALGTALAFGLAVELVQAPLPTRRFELLDVAANGAGVALALLVWWIARWWRGRSGHSST